MTDSNQIQDDTQPPKGESKKKRKTKSWRFGLWLLIGLVLLPTLLAGLVFLRLAISPMSVRSQIAELGHNLEDILPPGQILQFDDAQISLAEGGGIALRLTAFELREGDAVLLSAPRVDLELDFFALLDQQIRPSLIYVPSMLAVIQRDEQGRFIIAGQDPGQFDEPMGPPVRSQAIYYDPNEPEFVSLIYNIRRAIRPLADEELNKRPPRILIRNTKVRFQDVLREKSHEFDNVAFSY